MNQPCNFSVTIFAHYVPYSLKRSGRQAIAVLRYLARLTHRLHVTRQAAVEDCSEQPHLTVWNHAYTWQLLNCANSCLTHPLHIARQAVVQDRGEQSRQATCAEDRGPPVAVQALRS